MSEKTLSLFIDESGDFGAFEPHSPYYIVSMVLHNQDVDISKQISGLDERLLNLGYPRHAIHTGPLIRRESVYKDDLMEHRKRLFITLFYFMTKLDIHYITCTVRKAECPDVIALIQKLSGRISSALSQHRECINEFDRVIVYYDNGQIELTKILTSVFTALFSHVEFRRVRPVDYRLFQVADLICTVELLALKAEAGTLTRAEKDFFGSPRDFKKNFLKPVRKKSI